jgi:LPXTG-site transpeptidase (sortase) family protein
MTMTPTDDVRIDPEITTLTRAIDRRRLIRAGAMAGALMSLGWASGKAAPLAPFGETPVDPWETGECDDLDHGSDADSEANDNDVVLPFQIHIPAIQVGARVEVLEIVDGFLQDPSNGDDVAWYKETARAGSDGNAVFAGHLNWYGMPEAVFFSIDQLQLDDEILIRDGGCQEHRYLIEWVELIEVALADMAQITGQTDDAMLTLITCGGMWDPAISQYKQRTVVRARLADSSQGASEVEDGSEGDGSGAPDESPAIVPRDSD